MNKKFAIILSLLVIGTMALFFNAYMQNIPLTPMSGIVTADGRAFLRHTELKSLFFADPSLNAETYNTVQVPNFAKVYYANCDDISGAVEISESNTQRARLHTFCDSFENVLSNTGAGFETLREQVLFPYDIAAANVLLNTADDMGTPADQCSFLKPLRDAAQSKLIDKRVGLNLSQSDLNGYAAVNQRVEELNCGAAIPNSTPSLQITDVIRINGISNPRSVAADADGNIHVMTGTRRKIYSDTGSFIEEDNVVYDQARGIHIDGNDKIYIGDIGHHRLSMVNGNNYSAIGPESGSGGVQFNRPSGAATDSSGAIYVADTLNHNVKIFPHGWPVSAQMITLGNPGSAPGHFAEPHDVEVDNEGFIYVVEKNNDRVQIFNAQRQRVGSLGFEGNGPTGLSEPQSVAVDSNGYVFIADTGNSRIQVFHKSGAHVQTITDYNNGASSFIAPRFISVDAWGKIYIVDGGNNRIIVLHDGIDEDRHEPEMQGNPMPVGERGQATRGI